MGLRDRREERREDRREDRRGGGAAGPEVLARSTPCTTSDIRSKPLLSIPLVALTKSMLGCK